MRFPGAQPVGVSRELSPRREGARQLQLLQQEPAPPLAKEPTNDSVRTRGDEQRKGGGRRPAAVPAKQQQQQQVLTPRKEVPAAAGTGGGKRGGGRPGKEPVGTVERYRQEHDDGSITWGYENEDGSYKVYVFFCILLTIKQKERPCFLTYKPASQREKRPRERIIAVLADWGGEGRGGGGRATSNDSKKCLVFSTYSCCLY